MEYEIVILPIFVVGCLVGTKGGNMLYSKPNLFQSISKSNIQKVPKQVYMYKNIRHHSKPVEREFTRNVFK
jgi:hypothetical protein